VLEIIDCISRASGHKKQEILNKNHHLREILEYTYNPFKKYFITAPDIRGAGSVNILEDSFFQMLDLLSTRELSGAEAEMKVRQCLQAMDGPTCELAKRIIDRDLRAGIGIRTINTVFPGLIPLTFDGSKKPSVMLLKSYKKKRTKIPVLAAVKKDGVRGRYIGGKLVTRSGHEVLGVDHLLEALESYPYELDAEITVPGHHFDSASGLIRNHQQLPTAILNVFDIPSVEAIKAERYNILAEHFETGVLGSSHIQLIPHYPINSFKELDLFFAQSVNDGEEGIVIYDPNSLYKDKRGYDWQRRVPIKSVDCRVIGFYEGTGANEGSLGGIVVQYKNREVRVGTGFKSVLLGNEKTLVRSYIWENKDRFMGVVATIEYKEETKKGSLRQPRFKGWRWDK